MPSLRNVQMRSYRAFIDGDFDAIGDLLAVGALTRRAQVNVYQNNARETFRKALLAAYPVVARLVGNACFAGLAAKYLLEHPSMDGDLQHFGENFPDFLNELYSTTSYRYLPDVARLELACEQVLLEPETDPVDPFTLSNMPTEALPEMRLVPAPAARLHASDYPTLDIWRMNSSDDGESTLSLNSKPSRVLVVRKGGDAVLRELSVGEFHVADHLSQGLTLAETYKLMAMQDLAAEFKSALVTLLSFQMFSEITTS